MSRTKNQNYYRLKEKLEKAIVAAKGAASLQVMPDDVWEAEARRMEWITEDQGQWDYNNNRLARLTKVYDKCFPKRGWVIGMIEALFESEEGPLYD